MQGRIARSSIVAALTAFVVGLTAGVVITLNTGRADGADPLITASVGTTPSGQPLPRSFVGVSLEFNWLHFYTGRNPKRIDPVLITLLRNLAPGQTPSVRIGGESTDSTWWPIAHQKTPQGVSYSLSNKWLAIVKGMASALGARLLVGLQEQHAVRDARRAQVVEHLREPLEVAPAPHIGYHRRAGHL